MAGPLGFRSYEVENDDALARALNRAIKSTDNLEIPLNQIGDDFRKSRKAIFGLKSPGQYPDLSKKPFRSWWEKDKSLNRLWPGGYKEYKEKKWGFAYPILKRTGKLEKAVIQKGAPGNLNIVRGTTARFGVKDSVIPYAKYQQDGTKRIPMRKFLFIGPEAPQFAKGDTLKGFPERALNTLNSFILRQTGKSIEEATGVAPIIRTEK